jgi:hypothetical protein
MHIKFNFILLKIIKQINYIEYSNYYSLYIYIYINFNIK